MQGKSSVFAHYGFGEEKTIKSPLPDTAFLTNIYPIFERLSKPDVDVGREMILGTEALAGMNTSHD